MPGTTTPNPLNDIESRQDFISYRQIGQLNDYNHQNRQQEWLAYLDELKEREDLLLLYDFQQKRRMAAYT